MSHLCFERINELLFLTKKKHKKVINNAKIIIYVKR